MLVRSVCVVGLSALACSMCMALVAGGRQPTGPAAFAQQPRKIDEYPDIRLNDEKARLDNLVIELQSDPTARAHIIGYGGKVCRPGEALARAKRARAYLISPRGIEPERVVARDGGYRSVVGAELYIVPAGAPAPPASPTLRRCTPRKVRRRG